MSADRHYMRSAPAQTRRAFTLIELMLAVSLLGVMTAVSIATFRAVTTGWRVSREYVDRLERTDYAIDQLVSGLRCAFYPHSGEQSFDYGFMLTDKGDGDSPRDSDVIEWTKKGPAMVGGSATGDAVHRIQVMVLEEGDTTWGERIERTGLYARVKPMAKVIEPKNSRTARDGFSFANEELYRPVLVAKDVDGFNCRVQATEPSDMESGKKEDKDSYEDEFSASNTVPYKVQLTFYVMKEDPEYASRKQRVPILRTVRMPVHEQSLDGAAMPGGGDGKGGDGKKGGRK